MKIILAFILGLFLEYNFNVIDYVLLEIEKNKNEEIVN